MSDPVHAYLASGRESLIGRLVDFARLPSVGADPAYAAGMAAAQEFLEQRLRDLGFRNVRRLEAGGHAAIYADWLGAPGAPTFLVYGHYDVQPPDPLDKWISPPFEPAIRDGRLYGRGVSDDKGPSLIALETLGAFLTVEGRLPVNVKVLMEGEEETGSATLPAICERYRDLLAADAVISADGARWRADLPTVTIGMRGNAGFEMTVTTGVKDLHSGRYGGAVPNALHVAAEIVAGLRDGQGAIRVAGFMDGVAPLSEAERASLARIPFDEEAFYRDLDTAPTGEPGYTALERLWTRPTLEVNGLWGGYTGAGSKTVIPAEAHAKFTMRLVPGQDPERAKAAVMAHLEAHCPPGARVSFSGTRGSSGAYFVPPTHPLLIATEAALQDTLGAKPLRVRMGATLPMTDIVSRLLGIDTVMMSFSTSDEDYHAPNEFFRLSAIDEGLEAWVRLVRRLGEQTPGDYAPFRRAPA